MWCWLEEFVSDLRSGQMLACKMKIHVHRRTWFNVNLVQQALCGGTLPILRVTAQQKKVKEKRKITPVDGLLFRPQICLERMTNQKVLKLSANMFATNAAKCVYITKNSINQSEESHQCRYYDLLFTSFRCMWINKKARKFQYHGPWSEQEKRTTRMCCVLLLTP